MMQRGGLEMATTATKVVDDPSLIAHHRSSAGRHRIQAASSSYPRQQQRNVIQFVRVVVLRKILRITCR